MRTNKNYSLVFSIVALALFIIIALASGESKKSTGGDVSTPSEKNNITSVAVGQILHTDYFDVVVNKVSIKNKVSTGNQFADLPAEAGNKYLIINTTFKNTDTESRTIMEGSVWINYNGKDYEFDKSEAVLLEGWGIFFDQINPLTSKTTNLVYKIPSEISGIALWNPGRSDTDQVISLGEIK